MDVVIYVLLALLAAAAGAGLTYFLLQQRANAQFRKSQDSLTKPVEHFLAALPPHVVPAVSPSLRPSVYTPQPRQPQGVPFVMADVPTGSPTASSSDAELSRRVDSGDLVVVPVGVGTKSTHPEVGQESPTAPTEASISLDPVKADPEVQAYIRQANKNLGVLGFTEHGFRHVGLVSNIARNIIRLLEYDGRQQELAAIAGYLHDIGNVVSRHGHAVTGAVLAHPILNRLGMTPEDVAIVLGAIGSHGDDSGRLGEPVHPVSAALILADKSDVHRSRVRNPDPATFDQHDQVNYAATSSFLRVDNAAKTITLELTIDTEMAPVMQYFEIFLPRMLMSRRAAEHLDCVFHIVMNDHVVL